MNIILPSPQGEKILCPTLALVSCLEDHCGSIFLLAEKLAGRLLSLTDIITALDLIYRQAGFDISRESLADYFLKTPSVSAPILLAQILAALISPLQEMGLAPPGED